MFEDHIQFLKPTVECELIVDNSLSINNKSMCSNI